MESASIFVCLALVASTASGQTLSGYSQIDYVHSQESVDQLNDANGQPLNQNRVLIRRTRLKLAQQWRMLEYAVEADFNTVSGPQVGLRHVEVALNWPPVEPPVAAVAVAAAVPDAGAAAIEAAAGLDGGSTEAVAIEQAPPLKPRFPVSFRLGAGMFRAPFGHDVYELSNAERLFAEPSMLLQAFYPGEFDLGVRLTFAWRGLGVVVAMQNGEPIGERSFPGRDPNDAKDYFVRATARAEVTPRVTVEGGASTTVGTGFHAGTPATKDVLVWRDLNEDGVAQLTEIQAIRGSSATSSENFNRWGVGGDLRVKIGLPLGQLLLFGEAATATNLDRGIRPADPVLLGRAQRSLAAFGGFTQDIFSHGLIGVRVDYYAAALDQSQLQAGTLVRSSETFINYSFAAAFRFVGPQFVGGRGRVLVDYTLKQDPLGRDAAGRPADLRNDVFTVRLQLEI